MVCRNDRGKYGWGVAYTNGFERFARNVGLTLAAIVLLAGLPRGVEIVGEELIVPAAEWVARHWLLAIGAVALGVACFVVRDIVNGRRAGETRACD